MFDVLSGKIIPNSNLGDSQPENRVSRAPEEHFPFTGRDTANQVRTCLPLLTRIM